MKGRYFDKYALFLPLTKNTPIGVLLSLLKVQLL